MTNNYSATTNFTSFDQLPLFNLPDETIMQMPDKVWQNYYGGSNPALNLERPQNLAQMSALRQRMQAAFQPRTTQTQPATPPQALGLGAPPVPLQGNEVGQPNLSAAQMPGTYGVQQPLQFGFGQGNGVPGGDAIAYLEGLGFPIPDALRGLRTGAPARSTDVAGMAQRFGGINLPSLQGLNMLGPSGIDFLAGFFETMLGIPFEDIMWGAQQPFMGLGSGRQGRRRGLGVTY